MTSRIALAGALAILLSAAASAHPLAPTLLRVREAPSGSGLEVLFRTPAATPTGARLAPVWPARCRGGVPAVRREAGAVEWRSALSCPTGLDGARFRVAGLDRSRTSAWVRVEHADGRVDEALLRSDGDALRVGTSRGPLFLGFVSLGARHVAGGADHALFVAALVLWLGVGAWRRWAAALLAFTAGHAVTLALAVVGGLSLPLSVVEIGIAASLLCLAAVLARPTAVSPGLARLVALVFAAGLLHGLGFAGALRDVAWPEAQLATSLVAFHLGVEAAQLGIVAALYTALAAARRAGMEGRGWPTRLAAYGVGAISASWLLERGRPLLDAALAL